LKTKTKILTRTPELKAQESILSQQSFLKDLASLCKVKLSMIVVLSSVLSFMVVAGSAVSIKMLLMLALGGSMVTASANALNQVLEKDFDALMDRTSKRPLVTGNFTISTAVLIAGLFGAFGLLALAYINPIVSMLGAISLMLYAFVYTPLKRHSTLSVAIGAIPGALPILIGTVAHEGSITLIGLFLFSIQFFWQFPHFWAIGYRSFKDYRSAGFELVPYNKNTGEINPWIGKSSLIYGTLLLATIVASYVIGLIGLVPFALSSILALGYLYFCIEFARELNHKNATRLMVYSFGFMPIFLLIYIIF